MVTLVNVNPEVHELHLSFFALVSLQVIPYCDCEWEGASWQFQEQKPLRTLWSIWQAKL